MRHRFVFAALLATACASDSPPPPPPPPPTVVLGLLPEGGDAGAPAFLTRCAATDDSNVRATMSPEGAVVTFFATLPATFALRPPSDCYGAAGCGHLIVTAADDLTGAATLRTASAQIDFPVWKLASPFGNHDFTVAVVDDNDFAINGTDGKPAKGAIALNVLAPGGSCPDSGSAGDDQ